MNGHRRDNRVVKIIAALSASAALLLAGCVQMAPVPNYARSGDLLVVGLGGIQRNAGGNHVFLPSDLLVTITDSANATFTLNAQQVFKVFPDYGSQMNYQTIGGDSTMAPLPIQAFDGGWFAAIPLTIGGLPIPSLALGTATISITSPTGKLLNNLSTGNFRNLPALKEGNLAGIPVEIIAGTTKPNAPAATDYSNQFRAFTTTNVTALNIAPSSLTGITAVGGMQVAIKYPAARYSPTVKPLVVPYNHNPAINLQQNIVDNGDGTRTLNVVLTAPQGFAAKLTPLVPSLRDLNLKLIYFGPTGTATPAIDFQIISSKFIDGSGNVISGMAAVIGPMVL